MKVSLVATVKDAAGPIGEFLASDAAGVSVIEEPGANIARGRNAAVAAATHEVIAVSDADCVLDPEWLERLLVPIEGGADVAMGTYRPIVHGLWDACAAAVSMPEPDELREHRFMPSSRSVAFRREAYDAAGGYPEWLDL